MMPAGQFVMVLVWIPRAEHLQSHQFSLLLLVTAHNRQNIICRRIREYPDATWVPQSQDCAVSRGEWSLGALMRGTSGRLWGWNTM